MGARTTVPPEDRSTGDCLRLELPLMAKFAERVDGAFDVVADASLRRL